MKLFSNFNAIPFYFAINIMGDKLCLSSVTFWMGAILLLRENLPCNVTCELIN